MISKPSVAVAARQVVERLLLQSGLFDGADPAELSVWIDGFHHFPISVVKKFENLLTKANQEPYALAQEISSVSQDLTFRSRYLPLSIPLMCAVRDGSSTFNPPPRAAPCSSPAQLFLILLLLRATLITLLWVPVKRPALFQPCASFSAGQSPNPILTSSVRLCLSFPEASNAHARVSFSDRSNVSIAEPAQSLDPALLTPQSNLSGLLDVIFSSSTDSLDAHLPSLANFFQIAPSPLVQRLSSGLFALKSVQEALADQKKPKESSKAVLQLLQVFPLEALIRQSFQVLHNAASFSKEKLSLKQWSLVSDFVERKFGQTQQPSIDEIKSCLSVVQLHLSVFIETLEATESAGFRLDEALQGIRFAFFCLERLAHVIAERSALSAANALVGSLDANTQLLRVFLAPSDVGIRVTEIAAATFFQKSSFLLLLPVGASGFVPYVEKIFSALATGVEVSDSLLRKSAEALLPFIPAFAAPPIYAAALSQSWDMEHWIWHVLLSTFESAQFADTLRLPVHLRSFVGVQVHSLKIQPTELICRRLVDILLTPSKAVKIESLVLSILVDSLIMDPGRSEPDFAFNPFDAFSTQVLSQLLSAGKLSAEMASIVSLALVVQSYIYDVNGTVGAQVLRLLQSAQIDDSFLPVVAAFLRVSSKSSSSRTAVVSDLSRPATLQSLLEASARSDLAGAILGELNPAPEMIAQHFRIWPVQGNKVAKVSLSTGALSLLAGSVLFASVPVDTKLISIVLKELFIQGLLSSRSGSEQFDSWLILIRKDPLKLKALSSSDVKAIIRALLKDGIRDSQLLSISTELLRGMKPSLRADTLKDLHELFISHPLFLDVLFGTAEEVKGDTRAELAAMMLYVYSNSSEIEKSDRLLRVYLGAYSASLSKADRAILRILQLLEQDGLSLARAGMVWGAQARKAMLSQAAQQQPKTDDIMDVDTLAENELEQQIRAAESSFFDGKLIEATRVSATLRRFPAFRKLDCRDGELDCDGVADFYNVCGSHKTPLETIYDPAFVVPFFSLALRSFDTKDPKKFADIGALAFTLMCLSCEDDQLRQEAYTVLALFDIALGPIQLAVDAFAEFREQPQLRQLMNSVKYAITSPNQRITSIVGSFLAQSTFVAVRAEHPMCTSGFRGLAETSNSLFLTSLCRLDMNINEFLSSRGFLDLETVPMFRQLFFSTSLVDFRRDREWLLRIIAHGLLLQQDLEQLQRRRALGLLELHVAALAVASDREQGYIWTILQNAIRVDSQHDYTLNEAILPWATDLLYSATRSSSAAFLVKTVSNVCSLLQTICQLSDIEEVSKSSLIALQLQGIAAAAVDALRASPLSAALALASTDEEKRDAVSLRLTALRWLLTVLARFGTHLHAHLLDASLVERLVEEVTECSSNPFAVAQSALQTKASLVGTSTTLYVPAKRLVT